MSYGNKIIQTNKQTKDVNICKVSGNHALNKMASLAGRKLRGKTKTEPKNHSQWRLYAKMNPHSNYMLNVCTYRRYEIDPVLIYIAIECVIPGIYRFKTHSMLLPLLLRPTSLTSYSPKSSESVSSRMRESLLLCSYWQSYDIAIASYEVYYIINRKNTIYLSIFTLET